MAPPNLTISTEVSGHTFTFNFNEITLEFRCLDGTVIAISKDKFLELVNSERSAQTTIPTPLATSTPTAAPAAAPVAVPAAASVAMTSAASGSNSASTAIANTATKRKRDDDDDDKPPVDLSPDVWIYVQSQKIPPPAAEDGCDWTDIDSKNCHKLAKAPAYKGHDVFTPVHGHWLTACRDEWSKEGQGRLKVMRPMKGDTRPEIGLWWHGPGVKTEKVQIHFKSSSKFYIRRGPNYNSVYILQMNKVKLGDPESEDQNVVFVVPADMTVKNRPDLGHSTIFCHELSVSLRYVQTGYDPEKADKVEYGHLQMPAKRDN